jgi:hypothetical protein
MNIFREALAHCRWKSVCRVFVQEIHHHLSDPEFANKTFAEIMHRVVTIDAAYTGVGVLTIYDTTAAICAHRGITIYRVYLVGNGPRRAARLLHLQPRVEKINNQLRIRYVTIEEVIAAFDGSEGNM